MTEELDEVMNSLDEAAPSQEARYNNSSVPRTDTGKEEESPVPAQRQDIRFNIVHQIEGRKQHSNLAVRKSIDQTRHEI